MADCHSRCHPCFLCREPVIVLRGRTLVSHGPDGLCMGAEPADHRCREAPASARLMECICGFLVIDEGRRRLWPDGPLHREHPRKAGVLPTEKELAAANRWYAEEERRGGRLLFPEPEPEPVTIEAIVTVSPPELASPAPPDSPPDEDDDPSFFDTRQSITSAPPPQAAPRPPARPTNPRKGGIL